MALRRLDSVTVFARNRALIVRIGDVEIATPVTTRSTEAQIQAALDTLVNPLDGRRTYVKVISDEDVRTCTVTNPKIPENPDGIEPPPRWWAEGA